MRRPTPSAQSNLFEQAIAASRAQAAQHQAELTTITAQTAKAGIERYLDAFEAGTMSDEACGQRVQSRAPRSPSCGVRQTELHAALDVPNIQAPTCDELTDLAEQAPVAVGEGPTPARKRLLHALIHAAR